MILRAGWKYLLAVPLLVSTACGMPSIRQAQEKVPIRMATALPPLPTLNPQNVQRGKEIYQTHCASCHGENAEGKPDWKKPGPDGNFPPPPHDDTGHTWHHPDRLIREVIRDGWSDPLKPDSPLTMPAFGDKLSDDEILLVIEYFKSLWSKDNRLWQWEMTLKDLARTPSP